MLLYILFSVPYLNESDLIQVSVMGLESNVHNITIDMVISHRL